MQEDQHPESQPIFGELPNTPKSTSKAAEELDGNSKRRLIDLSVPFAEHQEKKRVQKTVQIRLPFSKFSIWEAFVCCMCILLVVDFACFVLTSFYPRRISDGVLLTICLLALVFPFRQLWNQLWHLGERRNKRKTDTYPVLPADALQHQI